MTHGNQRKLSDILDGRNLEELARNFESIEAAVEYEPVPSGTYEVDFVQGQLCRSASGNTGYVCHFEISDGEFRGRRIYHTLWLTEAAMPYSKRDLAKLGIHSLQQCEHPVQSGIFCKVRVAERTDDDGTRSNRVTRIDGVGKRTDPTADSAFGSRMPANLGGGAAR